MSAEHGGDRTASVASSGTIERATPAAPAAAQANNERLRFALACAAAALTFVVIVASAFMRHTQAGLGCADWPTCYARIAADATTATPTSIGVHMARVLHRLAASAALVLVVGILLLSRRAADRRQPALAGAALLVALALAALGLATPGARLPASPLGNLAGGLLMLALLAALASTIAPGVNGSRRHDAVASQPGVAAPSSRLRALVLVLLAAVFVQAIVGGLIGTQYALRVCPELGLCTASAGESPLGAAWNPFREPIVDSGRIVAPASASLLHAFHRLLGIVLAVATLALAFATRLANRPGAVLLASLALAAPLLGATAIVQMPALTITVLHNAVAAALIATLAYLGASLPAHVRARRPSR